MPEPDWKEEADRIYSDITEHEGGSLAIHSALWVAYRRGQRESEDTADTAARILAEGPRAASCRTYQGHDYNASGVCVRGCGIPEEGYVHSLQRELYRVAVLVGNVDYSDQEVRTAIRTAIARSRRETK